MQTSLRYFEPLSSCSIQSTTLISIDIINNPFNKIWHKLGVKILGESYQSSKCFVREAALANQFHMVFLDN